MHDFAGPAEHDKVRNEYMRELGLQIVRIPASEVFQDPDAVAESIVRMCAGTAGPSTTQLR